VNHPGRYDALHQPTIAKNRSPAEAADPKQLGRRGRGQSR
jgi:hypothetical protein